MKELENLKRGDLVIYNSFNSKEFGIVTSFNERTKTAHVRFIRNTANSESVKIEDLNIIKSMGKFLEEIEK